MKTRLKKIGLLSLWVCLAALCMLSCRKDNPAPSLSADEVYISEAVTADTTSYHVVTEKDTLIAMKFSAALKNPSSVARTVTFQVDTSKISNYRAKYGNAYVLPAASYNIAWLDCTIPAGDTQSKPAEINIVREIPLRPASTYVLPVVLKSIDGQIEGITGTQVFYLVVKTAESNLISKADWKVISYSSVQSYGIPSLDALFSAVNAIDNNLATSWSSKSGIPMPQYIVIDMGAQTQLGVVTYNTAATNYPTSVKIELSTDGSNWTNKGTYPGAAGAGLQTISIGASTGRYLRFTVLASVGTTGVVIQEIGAQKR